MNAPLLNVEATKTQALQASAPHPLDPLSCDEIAIACDTLKTSRGLDANWRFPIVTLREPSKAVTLAHKDGLPISRAAYIVLFNGKTGETVEAEVDTGARVVTTFDRVPIEAPPFGQAPIILEEVEKADRIVKAHVPWREAIKRRGLTEAEVDLVHIDPISPGYFGSKVEEGRRILRAVGFYRADARNNAYAHPIDGVMAVVDLLDARVVELFEDETVIPVPKKRHDYGDEALPPPRDDLKPLDIVQSAGPSFTVDGWSVSWQKWSFRVGFTPREGLVLHQLSYQDGERLRPILFRASLTEMVVPYADPTINHYWKSAFDAGEYGLGKLANALELGCDCLGHIHYFDVPAADDNGEAIVMPNAICMHEEDYGLLWKHNDYRSGISQTRRSRRLVISFFATVGNYDYGFYWYLYQDGTIQFEAKLTGIIQTTAVRDGEDYAWGGMVDENLGGPTHQHFFNARLHMMVDGDSNTVSEHEFVPRPWGHDNPRGNVFDATARVLKRERDAAREADGRTGRFWKVVNPDSLNRVGKPTGYKLVVNHTPVMLAQDDSTVGRRGAFAKKHLWVTPYAEKERYASGNFPNQYADAGGLPTYVKQNRSIENTDIVVWHTFGHTHVCKPEDFPIMPVEYTGFTLKPVGFFDGNAAQDVPGGRNEHSVRTGAKNSGSCCGGAATSHQVSG